LISKSENEFNNLSEDYKNVAETFNKNNIVLESKIHFQGIFFNLILIILLKDLNVNWNWRYIFILKTIFINDFWHKHFYAEYAKNRLILTKLSFI